MSNAKNSERFQLRKMGISFRHQEEMNLRTHVIADDPRYPILCVNGDLNFGMVLDSVTRLPEGPRLCICKARGDDACVCDLR